MIRKAAFLVLSLWLAGAISPAFSRASGEIRVLEVDDVINPIIAEYITDGIEKAVQEQAELLIIQLDTPGGLDRSMRIIIKEMLNSSVPTVVYVAPSGSRAASAGVFITIAAHIGAMAPGTNMGAAHPVAMGGEKMDPTLSKKIENDAVAYIRSIAEKRGKNADWAEKAVRQSVSISEKEALQLKVIDLIAPSLPALLKALNGRKVETVAGPKVLRTAGKKIVHQEMNLRQRVLALLSDPNVAYLLLMLGFYGLIFELSSPGAVLPGIIGGICLVLGLYALQMLPVNYAGLRLILLAIILFRAALKVPSYGALTIGGIIAMVLGSLMLIDTPATYLRISLQLIVPMAIATAAFFSLLVRAVFRAHRIKPATGQEGLVGDIGVVRSWGGSTGRVFVQGELWEARSEDALREGEEVRIIGVEGLRLRVKRKEAPPVPSG
ncbi:MAG: nodulation protein NfeD [Candidatus Tectomicrobia bacterium]|uniref:Nodulation protein NfeD n=1 Tax=Tectimicrobiota bacterium TaxID=2528274 RepID=A0A932CM25_UNCTE|nr:nodulation protein NfeD [Candidatus Tectomicrobia bacterium]